MKKVLILILAMVLSFSVFALAACQTPCETHVDANHDGICDVCATANLPVVHADSNHDGKCDICAADYREACADVNPLDGKCDVCGAAVAHTCVDTATVDGKCDICGADVAHTCVDTAKVDGKCDICGADVAHDHIDAEHNGKCDICGTTVEVKHVDNNHDGVCDVCQVGDLPYEHVDEDTNFKCDVCGKVLEHDCVDANTDCWCDVCEAAMHADNNHDGFCDVCDTSTGEPEHKYVEGVCSCGAKEEWLVTLEAAQDFLRASYIEEPARTAGDFKVLAQVPAGEGFLPVTWTVELVSGGNADSVKVGTTEGTETTIEIDEEQMDVYYKLIGTVTDSEGRKLSVSFDRELPNYNLVNWKDYVAAPKDYTLSVQGVVTALTGKSIGNTYNTIYIQDNDGGYYIYDMASDPIADGIKVGMTIKVRGVKDIYSGTHEVKEAVAEIVDQTIKTIEPADYTTIYTNAQSLKAEDLVAKQGYLVTIKGVQITGQNLDNGYLKFKLGDLESYIRISGSVCPLTKDEQAKFKADHASHFGWTANATGVICVYDGAFYLTPVNANAFEYTALPELDEAGEVAFEKGALTLVETIVKNESIELPAKGLSYADVTIAWDFKAETAHDCASISDGKLHVELPAEATTITLVATLTSGSVSDTKEITISVAAGFVMSETHAYVGFTNQVKAEKQLYLDGGVSGRYLTTTEDASKAVAIYAEKAEGGYKLYILDGETKKYITMYANDEGKDSVKYDAEGTTVYSYNPVVNAFTSTLNGVEKYLGTYNTFNTISVSNLSYINADNTGVSQFPLELLPVAEGVAYTASVTQVKLEGKVLYLDGGVSGRYLTTTEDATKAVSVYAEKVEGGFKFYILDGEAKKYITIYANDEGKDSVKYDAEGTTVYAYNPTVNAWASTFNNKEKYLGTYNTFNTISVSNLSYITAENTGVEQFPLVFNLVVAAEHTCESACPICTGCLDSECAEEACATKCSCVETEAPVAGTYVVEMYQSKKEINLYLTGEVSGYYLATSESSNNAMTVTLAKLENGKYTIQLANGKYLAMAASGTHINAVMQETACEFTWNAKLGNFTVAFDGTEYFFGTYGDFTTIGTCKLSYASTNYQAKLVAPLAHTCESVCETCKGCLDAECTEEACTTKCTCPPPHECESVCPVCEGCTDSQCTEDVCATKCTCTVVDASDLELSDGITTNVTLADGITLLATEEKAAKVTANSKSIDGFSFTQRLQLNGTMGDDYRAIKFELTGACTIVVYGMAGSSSATDRAFVLKNSAFEVVNSVITLGDQIYKVTFEVDEAGTYYIGSSNSGMNIYGIVLAYKPEAPATQMVVAKYAGETTTNMVADTNNATSIGLDATIFNVVSTKTGNNHVGLNKDGSTRLYGPDSCRLTISVAEGYQIVSVKVTLSSSNGGTLAVSNGTADLNAVGGVYTITGDTVVFYASSSTQVRIDSFEIVYASAK
ncbi:MAG: hypothetical protein IJF66_06925 [Clostridia bacterium]|nr:hypothetical protein [Clostridia bacterium]